MPRACPVESQAGRATDSAKLATTGCHGLCAVEVHVRSYIVVPEQFDFE